MRTKKSLAFLLCLCFLICISFSLVSDAVVMDSSKATYIRFTNEYISVGLLSTTVRGEVQGNSSVTSVKIKLELQKKSGSNYSTIKTWEESFFAQSAFKTESKVTSPFNKYRLKATYTVYTSTGSETKVAYA